MCQRLPLLSHVSIVARTMFQSIVFLTIQRSWLSIMLLVVGVLLGATRGRGTASTTKGSESVDAASPIDAAQSSWFLDSGGLLSCDI